MGEQVADFILHRLSEWGVRRIYGYPGDGINGLMGALGRAEERFEFIQVRHEETAAFMACAHAKFTGRVGVCLATSGPGAIHLLNGLYDARMDHQPVVAIVGQAKRMSLGGDFQQEVDLSTLFKDVASHYVQTITTSAQARHVVDRAFRIAMAERTVTCIIVPNDVQELPSMMSPPRMHGAIRSSVGYNAPRVVPQSADLQRAADVLNAGKRVAMLVGDGAMQMNGNSELVTVAKYWKRWRNRTLVIGVLNNRDLNQVTWEQRALAGDPKLSASQDVPDFPYARYAELLGLKGCCTDKPESVAHAWEKALTADRPCVVDIYVDPNVPPLPPHISFKQARAYMSALWKGDPDTADVLRRSASDFIEALIPHR